MRNQHQTHTQSPSQHKVQTGGRHLTTLEKEVRCLPQGLNLDLWGSRPLPYPLGQGGSEREGWFNRQLHAELCFFLAPTHSGNYVVGSQGLGLLWVCGIHRGAKEGTEIERS